VPRKGFDPESSFSSEINVLRDTLTELVYHHHGPRIKSLYIDERNLRHPFVVARAISEVAVRPCGALPIRSSKFKRNPETNSANANRASAQSRNCLFL